MLSEYQIKIDDSWNISIGNIKRLVYNFFWYIKVCDSLWKLATLLEARIKTKKVYYVLEFNQSQW